VARFLVDEPVARAVARGLAAAGHDVADVRDIGMRGATDDAIAARAKAESRLVISTDLDFANALRFPPKSHPGMVVVRMPDTVPPEEVAARVVTAIRDAIGLDGAITIIEPTRVRTFG
jgi:predicted nuclease of predicted toxin-antitoxin system